MKFLMTYDKNLGSPAWPAYHTRQQWIGEADSMETACQRAMDLLKTDNAYNTPGACSVRNACVHAVTETRDPGFEAFFENQQNAYFKAREEQHERQEREEYERLKKKFEHPSER